MNSLETNTASGKKATILIVDDQPTNIRSLSGILKEEYTIMVATNGAKALKIARSEKKPDLILLDIKMPEMDGYEVLRRVNADESTRDIPVIFVTAKDAEGDEEFGLELGAVDYISKPYIPGVVKVRVKQMLDRKQAERLLEETNRELEDRVKDRTSMLLQSEKMASLGVLAAGVAHEINNPASFINGNLETLKDYVSDLMEMADVYENLLQQVKEGRFAPEKTIADMENLKKRIDIEFIREDIWDLLNESLEGISRIGRIVSDLKDFSHVDKEDSVAECDLNELVDKAIKVAWNELKYKCEVVKDYAELPPVPVNSGQVSQVVLNLLINSAQAIETHGSLRVATRLKGNNAIMEIIDDGPGIPEEILTKIFDPFFTTKPVGKGTGLGLHICQKIVNGHGGRVHVDSHPGEGTTVTITLPLNRKNPERQNQS